jgi:hypothetical protein
MITVLTFQITIDYVGYPNWIAPRKILVNLDEVTFALSVEIRNGSGTLIESPVSGPPLFSGMNGMATQLTPLPLYQWCDGTTLKKINVLNTFPYASIAEFPNNVACQIGPVCDVEIINEYAMTPATGPSNADGSFTVSATSSNGTIRYSLDADFDYTTEGNTSGIFSGLLPGTYTVYAKDSVGCQDSISIILPVTREYGVKYRCQYTAINGFYSRIDILERGYSSDISTMIHGESPIVISYEDSDRYTPFIASKATIQLVDESEDQYSELFTDDERKFLVEFYKDLGSGLELKWTGFIVPSLQQKSFVRSEYNMLELIASDQLGILKTEPFVDHNGNNFRSPIKQMSGICAILKKTGLTINIRSADNIFETTMDVSDDEDPLDQGYFDPRIFYVKDEPKKCDHVLNFLLNCKSGLRLFQSDGYWWIIRSEIAVGTFEYREFDIDGVYVDNSSFNPVIERVLPEETGGVQWRDASQLKYYETNYGTFTLEHQLAFDDNLIDEGAFEEEDIIDLGDGNKAFKNWNTQANQPGLRYGLEYVENKDSKGAYFADFDQVTSYQTENILYSYQIPIESNTYGTANLIKFSFEYNIVPNYFVPWVLLAWNLKLTNTVSMVSTYLQPNKQWNATEDRNDIYVSNFNKFEKFEITAPLTDVIQTSPGVVEISFFFHNHIGRDFDDLADLQALSTSGIDVGKRYIVSDGSLSYFYELEYSQDAESSPDVLHGSDFDTFTNPKVWRMKGMYKLGILTSLVNKVLIDNVKFSYIPYNPLTSRNYSPPTEAYYEQVANEFVRANFEETFLLGDLPDMVNAANLYRGWLRLSDGTPSVYWKRKNISEESKLLTIALNDRIAQLSAPVERIEAVVNMSGVFVSFLNAIQDGDNRYLITRYELNDRHNMITLAMDKTVIGEDGPPANLGSYDTEAYSSAYKIS